MAVTAKTGTGTTITSTGFTMKVIGVDPFSIALDALDASNMSSTDFLEKLPADLADLGEMSLEVEFDSGFDIFTLVGVAQLWTINPGGRGTGHLIKATGFVTGYQGSLPLNAVATGTVTITWDGDQFTMAAAT